MEKNNRLVYFMVFVLIGWCFECQGQLSVVDFGAKGDGKADDTKAFENAILSLEKSVYSTYKMPNLFSTGLYIGNAKYLEIPAGVYKISKTLKLGTYINIKGDNAIIISDQKGSIAPYTAFSATGWQAQINGLQIVGFRTGISLNNNNLDVGQIVVQNCSFFNCDLAIELNVRSSISVVEKCRFNYNKQALNLITGDKLIFQQNWITSGEMSGSNPAQIVNYGVMTFKENILVPKPISRSGIEPAWINNYGSLTCEDIRQGGEDGSFTLVNNFAKFDNTYPVIPNYLVVKNSECYSTYRLDNELQPAVIRLFEIPNQIVLEDIRGAVDAKVIGVSNTKIKNPSQWAKAYYSENKIVKIRIANVVGGNFESSGTILPAYLKPFAESDYYQIAKTKNIGSEEVVVQERISKSTQKAKETGFTYLFNLLDIDANYLVSFSGNPNVNGSGLYRGGVILGLRCNGTYYNGQVSYQLVYDMILNQSGGSTGKNEEFSCEVVWESTGTVYKPSNDKNFTIILRVNNSTGVEKVNIINLNEL